MLRRLARPCTRTTRALSTAAAPRPPPIYIVDSFTASAFGGNPAGVCVLDGSAASINHSADFDDWMRCVAAEMNLSETAFVQETGANAYSLRWWTPTDEVTRCC